MKGRRGVEGPHDMARSYEPGLPASPPPSSSPDRSLVEIRSASTELLTSEQLREIKELILTAYQEREDIGRQLAQARAESLRTSERFQAWDRGHVLKFVLKKSFSLRRAEADIAFARTSELEEQLRLTAVAAQVTLEPGQAESFFRMRDDFQVLAECEAIWDINAERATDKVRERTTAEIKVDRKRVKFGLGKCDLIEWDQEVPHMQNANGGDIFLYPGFILYRASKAAFSVIDFHDVKLETARVKFEETQGVPHDSKTIGTTWAKVNRDGSRDRRFADNEQIPVVMYAQLTFTSETGLWEVYLVSEPERAARFDKSWEIFVTSFDRGYSCRFENGSGQGEDAGLEARGIESRVDEVVGADEGIAAEVQFACKTCGQPIATNSDARGQEFYCPSCGEQLTVPEQTDG